MKHLKYNRKNIKALRLWKEKVIYFWMVCKFFFINVIDIKIAIERLAYSTCN